MKSLRIVLHNKSNKPIFMDLMVDDLLAKAIQTFGVTRAEFLISDNPKIFTPKTGFLPDLSKLGDFPQRQKIADIKDFHIES